MAGPIYQSPPASHYVNAGADFEFALTPTQYAKLQPGKRIGCGASACAYERPDGRVVKITFDANDIEGALRGRKAGCRVVAVDEAYRLSQIVNGEPVFASIVERLQRLPGVDPRRQWLNNARDLIGDYAGFVEARLEKSQRIERFRLGNRGRQQLRTAMCRTDRMPDCYRFTGEVARLMECMGRQGLAVDDVRAPNVGLDSKGRLRLLDVSHRDVVEMRRHQAHNAAARFTYDDEGRRFAPGWQPLPWHEPGETWPVLAGRRAGRRPRRATR